ncbi:hypothetical protein Mapa_001110 [Marchantia paleacea]|nr:hypothetical protein Mapa_001110 [Marchantia paleacea]
MIHSRGNLTNKQFTSFSLEHSGRRKRWTCDVNLRAGACSEIDCWDQSGRIVSMLWKGCRSRHVFRVFR